MYINNDNYKASSNGIFKILAGFNSDDEEVELHSEKPKKDDSESKLIDEQLTKSINSALAMLDEDKKNAFIYSAMNEMTDLQIAKRMKITEPEVIKLIQDAKSE